MLGGFGKGCDQFWLKKRLKQAALQILTGKAPGEWFVESGILLAEGDDALCQLLQLVQSVGVSTLRWRIETGVNRCMHARVHTPVSLLASRSSQITTGICAPESIRPVDWD